MRICVVIPTFNERENIELLLTRIVALGLNAQIVVIDDDSPDQTWKVVEALSQSEPGIHLIRRPHKMGLGSAHIAGMKWALDTGSSHIITMDADFSHNPKHMPSMLEAARESDIVIGSRYVAQGATSGCTLPRKVLSWVANSFARLLLALPARDCTAGFRCYRRSALQKISFEAIEADGYSFLIEMLYLCKVAGLNVSEVPIVFKNRERGDSKISQEEIWKALLTVVRLACQ